jgi:hypothetical protein
MKLTGKCKENFEKWFKGSKNFLLIDEYDFYSGSTPSMQYGVYVDFFDSVGVYLTIDNYYHRKRTPKVYYEFGYDTGNNWIAIKTQFKTRQEAREQAIIKANEIYNIKE